MGVFQGLILAGVENPDDIADALEEIADEVEDAGFDMDQGRLDEYEMVTVRNRLNKSVGVWHSKDDPAGAC